MASYLVLISVQVQIVFYTSKIGRSMKKDAQEEQTFEYKYCIITMPKASPHSFMAHNNSIVYYKDSAVERNVQWNDQK